MQPEYLLVSPPHLPRLVSERVQYLPPRHLPSVVIFVLRVSHADPRGVRPGAREESLAGAVGVTLRRADVVPSVRGCEVRRRLDRASDWARARLRVEREFDVLAREVFHRFAGVEDHHRGGTRGAEVEAAAGAAVRDGAREGPLRFVRGAAALTHHQTVSTGEGDEHAHLKTTAGSVRGGETWRRRVSEVNGNTFGRDATRTLYVHMNTMPSACCRTQGGIMTSGALRSGSVRSANMSMARNTLLWSENTSFMSSARSPMASAKTTRAEERRAGEVALERGGASARAPRAEPNRVRPSGRVVLRFIRRLPCQ